MTKMKIKTEYVFGNDSLLYLKDFLAHHKYQKILLIYGNKSIKENGLYESITKTLKEININWIEYQGIKPNPLDIDVNNAKDFGIVNHVDLVIAAGGGSVIDSAKMIALLINNPDIKTIQDYYENNSLAKHNAIDLIAIPTTAATGSENNYGSVITFINLKEKRGVYHPSCTPMLCLQDPHYITSASNWQLASGIFDAFTHQIEQYFGLETFDWTKEYLFANMRNLWKFSLELLNDHSNLKAASNIMWTSTMSLNSLSSFNSTGDWNIHQIEHAISAKWNVTHGAGLALIMPSYIKIRSLTDDWYKQKALVLAKEVFNLDSVDALIDHIVDWIKMMQLPTKWTDFKEILNQPSDDELNFVSQHVLKQKYIRLKLETEVIKQILLDIK